MKASQDRRKKSEKGVLFGALETKETIDRHSSSIDKLTSLVNKLDMKLDSRKPNIELQSIRIEVEETFNTITEVIGLTIEIEVDQEIIDMEIAIGEAIIPKTIEEIIIDKIMVTKGTGIGTEV